MKAIPVAAGCWSERYESLRRHFLEQPRRFGATPLGLATMRREGLARWMHRWTEATTPLSRVAGPRPGSFPLPRPAGAQLQLTLLLAQMTAVHLPALIRR